MTSMSEAIRECKQRMFKKALYTLEENNVSFVACDEDRSFFIEDRFIYNAYSGRWRVRGKATWYNSRDTQSFIDRYVKKPDKEEKLNDKQIPEGRG